MARSQKRYQKLICRSLLLLGYLILFASQSNSRYFAIANFYVYSKGGNAANTSAAAVQGSTHAIALRIVTRNAGRPISTLQDNSRGMLHLSVDKRYSFQQGYFIPQIRAPGTPDRIIARQPDYASAPVYSHTRLLINSFRGPPQA